MTKPLVVARDATAMSSPQAPQASAHAKTVKYDVGSHWRNAVYIAAHESQNDNPAYINGEMACLFGTAGPSAEPFDTVMPA